MQKYLRLTKKDTMHISKSGAVKCGKFLCRLTNMCPHAAEINLGLENIYFF